MELTHERLREMLRYYPGCGEFMWLKPPGRKKPKSTVAGRLDPHGYVRISFDGTWHFAHRLAWFYMTGYWPVEQIDHINGDGTDNRYRNLREATSRENLQNRAMRPDAAGTTWSKKANKWVAQIRMQDGRKKYLGSFNSQAAAHQAYLAAKAKYHKFQPTPRTS